VFEAFVGALFMDMGFDACLAFVDGVVHKHVDLDDLVIESNFKDLLARYAQQHGMGAVEYEITEVHGPAHKRSFTTRAKIDGCAIGEGTAASKKESEMLAARHSLHVLDVAVTTPIAGGR